MMPRAMAMLPALLLSALAGTPLSFVKRTWLNRAAWKVRLASAKKEGACVRAAGGGTAGGPGGVVLKPPP